MDNVGNSHLPGNDSIDKPIPFDDGLDKQAPSGSGPISGSPGVSRAPLNLGGGGSTATPKPVPRIATPTPVARKTPERVMSSERITGVKTFFTKLHPGALEFLDDQINSWLKDNPTVHVKHVCTVTGEVQSKKTEPNIIVTVWF